MNKTELKHQVKDLYEVLNFYIDNVENGSEHIKSIIRMAKISNIIKHRLESREGIREIKRRKLQNEFIKTHRPFDIHEALNIDIKEARKKLKKFDFTIKEKNIILDSFKGGAKSFLNRYDGEVIN